MLLDIHTKKCPSLLENCVNLSSSITLQIHHCGRFASLEIWKSGSSYPATNGCPQVLSMAGGPI